MLLKVDRLDDNLYSYLIHNPYGVHNTACGVGDKFAVQYMIKNSNIKITTSRIACNNNVNWKGHYSLLQELRSLMK